MFFHDMRYTGTQKLRCAGCMPRDAVVVILTLTHRRNTTMQSVVAGQAPITLEWKKRLGSKTEAKKNKNIRTPPLRFILLGERFFHNFPKFGNNWRYVSTYGGVLSLFVKFSRTKNIKFVNIPIFGKKNQENMED